MFRIILKLARPSIESGGKSVFPGLGVIHVFRGTFFEGRGRVEVGWVRGESGGSFVGGKTRIEPSRFAGFRVIEIVGVGGGFPDCLPGVWFLARRFSA